MWWREQSGVSVGEQGFSSCTLVLLLFVSFLISLLFSSKWLISQPVIFTFCASNSPLQSATGKGRKRGERVSVVCSGFSGNANLENTIPKP